MEITIILRDIEEDQVEIEEYRLPYSDENPDSITTATALVDELQRCINRLGNTE